MDMPGWPLFWLQLQHTVLGDTWCLLSMCPGPKASCPASLHAGVQFGEDSELGCLTLPLTAPPLGVPPRGEDRDSGRRWLGGHLPVPPASVAQNQDIASGPQAASQELAETHGEPRRGSLHAR